MITRHFQFLKKAVMAFVGAALLFGLASCEILFPDQRAIPAVIPDPPTDDQMAVQVIENVPTAVMSSFETNTVGEAFVRRLPTTTSAIDKDTRMVLFKGDDLANISDADMKAIANLYIQGGFIAIAQPSTEQLLQLIVGLIVQLVDARTDWLTGDGDLVIAPEDGASPAPQQTAEADLLEVRAKNLLAMVPTKAGEDPMKEVLMELLIVCPEKYYCYGAQSQDDMGESSGKADGEETEVTPSSTESPVTPYTNGLIADSAAEWVNEAAQVPVKGLRTKAGGNDAINQLMGCSDEFTLISKIFTRDWTNKEVTREGKFKSVFRVWGVNDNSSGKDYYYVKQTVKIMVGGKVYDYATGNGYGNTFYWGSYEPRFYRTASNFKNGDDLYYGSWFQQYDASMELTGKGTINEEYALPGTDNNMGSKSIEINTNHSETNTIGFSIGANISESPGITPSFNYSHGWTDGWEFELSNTTTAKELKVVKNTEGNKVSWTYENSQPASLYLDRNVHYYCHTLVPDAVINDVDLENQVCWSVTNPEGRYTLNTYNSRAMRFITTKSTDSSDNFTWYNRWFWNKNSYTLKEPNRATQTWHFDVTPSTLGKEGHTGDKRLLTEALMNQFPDLFQTLIVLSDKTPESENTIGNVVAYAKMLINDENAGQTLREYALDLGCESYQIKWYTTDKKHNAFTLTVSTK